MDLLPIAFFKQKGSKDIDKTTIGLTKQNNDHFKDKFYKLPIINEFFSIQIKKMVWLMAMIFFRDFLTRNYIKLWC